MTSVQALHLPVTSKSHHSVSSPAIKPSATTFRKTASLGDMSGAATSKELPDNGAPTGSSSQVKENWDRFGSLIQNLLQTPLEFAQFSEKDQINPEEKYTALNQVARKINGNVTIAPGGLSFGYTESTPSRPSTPASSASTATDADNTIPTSHDLHPQAIDIKWPHQGDYAKAKGLYNLGNTCFANSVLQVLMHTPPLLRMLDELETHNGNHQRGNKICLTCELRKTRKAIWSGKGSSVNPTDITSHVKSICPTMRRGRQEDSHEFFRYSIDSLQNENLRELGASKAPHAVRETSWVHKIWGGRLRSRVHCTSCGANSDTVDAFLDLSLDIPRDTVDIRNALRNFAKEDRLEGRNKYKCEKCNKHVTAIKQMKIIEAPPVLSLHLKRFSPWGKKITAPINFTDDLVLGDPVYEGPGPIHYELYGVTLHYGSGPNNGHYISIVKNNKKQWHKMDDSDVDSIRQLSDSDKKNTYQLHYIRKAGTKLDGLIGQSSRNSTPAKGGRPELSRAYGANGDESSLNQPGTSSSHALQAGRVERERAQRLAAQGDGRGLKRDREETPEDKGSLVTSAAQAKKTKTATKFEPVRDANFYTSSPARKAPLEDPDATEDDEIEDDESMGPAGTTRNSNGDGSTEFGEWEGDFDPIKARAGTRSGFATSNRGRGMHTASTTGKKKNNRRKQSGSSSKGNASPFNPGAKQRGRARMQGKP